MVLEDPSLLIKENYP
jgi:hypothetical protein